MRGRRALLLAIAAMSATAAVFGGRMLRETHASELDIEPNSCAIACPAQTAYPGLSASVTCHEGFAPVCQCVKADKKMAGCEVLAAGD